ncbi:outer membrane beta-barrel protein [Pontibacter indicus]|uniref:Outer membrane protein beta-barrel domain-containing protein n=1 Tax=Pontibacter indicus TaxID=1317125 RepID=A0A1R3XFJ7_9BACT|nr:outer membrane beta-barrel protein [Pontibacter indicus]SIT89635.1 Outer membrane protein beta-barrel domain-containing protein [Pontibacter indicus]
MKTCLAFLLILLCCFSAFAQQESSYIENGKFTLGLNLQTVSYHIYYKEGKTQGPVRSGYFTPVFLNSGYQLSDRASVRLGFGLGGDRDRLTEQIHEVEYKHDSKTIAIVSSLSFYHTFLNLYRKVPVYGTVSLVPAYGFTSLRTTHNGADGPVSHTVKDDGLNVFAMAGVGFNYQISNRLYGNLSYFFYKKNLSGMNSSHYDWDQGYGLRSIIKSFELGMNYKL